MNKVNLALNICTYKREVYIKNNLRLLLSSKFFDEKETEYYNHLEIFVVDNASELVLEETDDKLHLIKNKNTGGSGGFQRGIEVIRKYDDFTHVIFMDDDVTFEMSCFYILFDFLKNVKDEYADRPVAGRMLDKDNPNIQWTAAEKWNGGDIKHVEFLRDITDPQSPYTPGKAIYDADADYGGFWFCCYPYSFVKINDILPFFLHCDDVEYGLRNGKTPIIIEGVHVWHETYEKKINPTIVYYDMRNRLFVNELNGLMSKRNLLLEEWKHLIAFYGERGDYTSSYMVIKGMSDYLKGIEWLNNIDSEKHHYYLLNIRGKSILNSIAWRFVEVLVKRKISQEN